jgi:hypothetical protein
MPIPDSEVTQGRASDEAAFTPPPSMARSASDWATSFIRGLAKGTEGMVGLPGDAVNALSHGSKVASDYISEKIGIDKGPEPSGLTILPSTEQVNKFVGGDEKRRNAIGKFTDAQPETPGGKYTQSIGEMVPGMVGGPGGLVRKGIQAVAGGVGSEAAGQAAKEYMPDHETAARVLGGIAGQGVPGVVRKAIAPSNIKSEREAAAEFLKKEGVDVTAGDLSGSKVTKHAEHALGTSPGAGGAYDITRDKINKQFTSAALKHIGEKGEELSPEVLRDASRKIGGEFDGLAARNSVKPDMAYVADALKAQQKYDDLFLNPLHKPLVEKIVEQQMNNVARGDISGKAYQAQASALREIQRGHGDQRVRDFAADMKDALDDAMERSIKKNNPDDLGKWQDARRKYRNLLVLERVAAGGGEDAAAGVVSAPRLRQAIVAEQGRRSYARGYGDFDELARAGNLLLSKPPTSGTSERAFLHAIPAAIGGVAGHALEGNVGGAAGTMLGVMAPGTTGKALMNPAVQGYLKNQIAKKLGVSVEYLDSLRPEMRDKLFRSTLAEHGRESTELPPITVEPE